MNEYNIWTTLFEHITKTGEDTCSHISKILTLLHDVEVVVGCNFEDFEYLVKHFSMLSRNADYDFEFLWMLLEFLDKRTHFYGLRSRSENKHYLFHFFIFMVRNGLNSDDCLL